MSRNIEMNYKNSDGSYEVLYPVTTRSNVGGILVPELTVNIDDGATVKAKNGSFTAEAVSSGGRAVLDLPAYGDWAISVTTSSGGGKATFNVDTVKQYELTLSYYTLTVTTNMGATVNVSMGDENYSAVATNGKAIFNLMSIGTWQVQIVYYNVTKSNSIEATDGENKSITIRATFSEMSWEAINNSMSLGDTASFAVGNSKQITLNGSAGPLSFSGTTAYAVIIGINHNSSIEGTNRLHLQISTNSSNTGLL